MKNYYTFDLNGRNWKIMLKSQQELLDYFHEENVGYYYGQTHFRTQEIWISDDTMPDQMRKTLYHELMHCYLVMCITSGELEFNEELVCDISANSHDIIHSIVESYLDWFENQKCKLPKEEFKEKIEELMKEKD